MQTQLESQTYRRNLDDEGNLELQITVDLHALFVQFFCGGHCSKRIGAFMLSTRVYGITITVIALGACSSQNVSVDASSIIGVAPVGVVVNSLKCGLARALVADHMGKAGLRGSIAKVKLEINVVADATSKASVTFDPGIPLFQGTKVSPSFSAGTENMNKYNTTVSFNIDLRSPNDAICSKSKTNFKDYAFSDWITGEVQQINTIAEGEPKVSMQGYIYETNFAVTKSSSAGADFVILPIKPTFAIAGSRQDIQHITILIDATHTDAKGKSQPNGKSFILPNQLLGTPLPGWSY